MKKIRFMMMTMLTAMLISCGTTSTVPITGRKHTLLVSDEQVLSLSNQEYTKYMKTAKPSTDATNTAMVRRVGTRLANAVETYLKNNGMASECKNFNWEFNLVQDKNINAFCMPGGKIVVYEGLLPVTKEEASLAIVLGHEIAHAVAKHSAEQMSKQMRQQYGTQIGGAILQAAGVSSSTTSYDPAVAIPFWQRMAAASGSSSNDNDIFSDHPSDAKRIAAIQKELPEAEKYYQASGYAKKATSTTTKKRTTSSRKSSKRR